VGGRQAEGVHPGGLGGLSGGKVSSV
jgi:hypothetical protein